MCCQIRKAQPLREALVTADAWMSGLRRDQSPTRAHAQQVAWDGKHGLVKTNPLVTWNDADVWRYITERELPYNALHDRGYASIGCMPCTRPGSGRSGRWVDFNKVECGIHA
jgi:phosphoadenosine phosphosulfate reductase